MTRIASALTACAGVRQTLDTTQPHPSVNPSSALMTRNVPPITTRFESVLKRVVSALPRVGPI